MIKIKEELIKLIMENPDLEIIPLVSYDSTNYLDEENTYNACEFSNPFKGRYCYYKIYNTKEFFLEQDKVLIEEYIYKNISQNKDTIDRELKKIKWKEAIFLYVNQRKEGF